MSVNRDALRREAKKLYKEQTKGVPKKQRIPFAQFFKQYKRLRSGKIEQDVVPDEDFNFEDLVNVNEISDDDVEVESTEEDNG